MVNIEKLTTSLQFIGAALALPAGAAGVYSAYHNYFSPEVMCQEMRNSTLATLEKNIPAEAKHALLRKEAGQFEAKCGEVEPETNTIFQVALHELEKPAPRAAQRSAPRRLGREMAAAPCTPQARDAPRRGSVHRRGASPATAPVAAEASLRAGVLGHAAHGWVAIEIRKGGKVTEAFFSGYAANGQSLPAAGTVLTSMALRPIWSEPQGPGPNDPTKLQGRLKAGECVRVVGIRPSPGRQWAEVEPTRVPVRAGPRIASIRVIERPSLPLPLAGEGWGGGSCRASPCRRIGPSLTSPASGGGEHTPALTARALRRT